MTAVGPGPSLLPGETSPLDIATVLLPDDRRRFEREFAHTLEAAKQSLDLAELSTMIEQWRGLALLQQDPDDFARLVRTASERLTGEPVPADEPLHATRTRLGL